MMSPDERLVHMANQIALNIAAQGHDMAVAMLADHILSFWDPRMKARILALDGDGLSPIAAAAIAVLRSRAAAPRQAAAAIIATGGSDAG